MNSTQKVALSILGVGAGIAGYYFTWQHDVLGMVISISLSVIYSLVREDK
jgi:hypothetical protein